MGLFSAIGGLLYSVGLQTGVINPMCVKGVDENGNEICINPNSPPPASAPPAEVPKPFYEQPYFWVLAGIAILIIILISSNKK